MEKRRALITRVGIVLLSLLAPGLGLLRLDRLRIVTALFVISTITLLLWRFGPPASFPVLLAVVATAFMSIAAGLWLSWKFSREIEPNRPWYTRWYSLAGYAAVNLGLNLSLTDRDHIRYRSFYLPSESMAPTLLKQDRFIAYMKTPATFSRGDLVMVHTAGCAIYVKRVAAVPGDRIGLKGGVVVLNGAPVEQHLVRSELTNGSFGPERARRLAEQFPGEQTAHEIYDIEQTPADDVSETQIPAGAVYLLGDNRDRSADSRVATDDGGLDGPVPIWRIAGRPLYVSWGSSKPIGTKLSR